MILPLVDEKFFHFLIIRLDFINFQGGIGTVCGGKRYLLKPSSMGLWAHCKSEKDIGFGSCLRQGKAQAEACGYQTWNLEPGT
jgi:hypothetical protein